MSTCADIDAAWASGVWEQTEVKAITPVYFQYGFTSDSEFEITKGFYGAEVNFVEATTSRAQAFGVTGELLYTYSVRVDYYLQKDTNGEAWADVREAFETIFDTVRGTLGATWGGTVDYWLPQADAPTIEEVALADTDCWRGRYIFTGIKQISIS